jgi:thiosulfate dehydrogenase [quinone] large subunit
MSERTAAERALTPPRYSNFQITALVALRMLVGWHFLYEGLSKIINPYWTSAGFLSESKWLFSKLFLYVAANPTPLVVVDFINKWGLLLIGLGLLLGCLTRAATLGGIALLFLYYVAAPPFAGYAYAMPAEGSYLIVNKVLIELAALLVLLAFPTGKIVGLDRLIFWKQTPGKLTTLSETAR